MKGTTNPHLRELVAVLRTVSYKENCPLWARVAKDLEKSTRRRRAVNINRISRNTKENEFVIVPGKVLADGEINHKLTVSALGFSKEAAKKIIDAGGKAISVKELVEKNPQGKNIRLIG